MGADYGEQRRGSGDAYARYLAGMDASMRQKVALTHVAHRSSGKILDLVRRPNLTVDVVPHFDVGGDAFVLAKMSYPRPLFAICAGASLDGSTPATHVTEPLNAIQESRPLGDTVEEVLARFGIPAGRIRREPQPITLQPARVCGRASV